jgi:succinyl-CoA synthetase alpha subunit
MNMKAICEALKSGHITKPLIAWCIGMCASIFPFEVQFGHASELARGNMETAHAKNQAFSSLLMKPNRFMMDWLNPAHWYLHQCQRCQRFQ